MSVMPQSLIMKKEKASLLLIIRSADDFEKLSKIQQKAFQMRIIIYQMKKKIMKKMTHDIKIINNALKASTRIYIFTANINVFIRDIIKTLIDKYQRSNAQITQQIFEHFRTLQHILPAKQKIEKWMIDWKNLYRKIENKKLLNLYENEKIFVDQFLNAKKKWTFNFCETWMQSLTIASKFVKFYKIIKQYRIVVEKHFNKTKNSFRKMNMINAILQN